MAVIQDSDLKLLAHRGALLVPQQISWRRANQLVSRKWAALYPFHQRWQGRLTITEEGTKRLCDIALPRPKEAHDD